jgi:hypothetical protein
MLRVGRMSLGARCESVRPDHTIGMGCKLVSAWIEVTVDEGVSEEQVLVLFGRFEPLHLPLSSSRWPMEVLGPVVQISALSVLDAGKQLTLSDAMARDKAVIAKGRTLPVAMLIIECAWRKRSVRLMNEVFPNGPVSAV